LEQVQKGGWFDASTRFVSVEGMVYSESRNRVAYVNLGAEVSVTGWTKSVVRIISFTPSQFGFWHWLFVMIFFAALGHAFEQLLALGPRRYFSSILNCLELLDAAFIFVLFVCQNSIITKMQSFDPSAADPWLKDATPDAFSIDYELISFVQVQRICAGISLLLSWQKFITHFNTLPIVGPITLGIVGLLQQTIILFFLLCYLWLLLGFAFCFYIFSTDVIDDRSFSHLWMSFATLIQAGLAGEFEFDSYESMDNFFGPIVFVIMIIVSQTIMTNLFIAIISNQYEKAAAKGEKMWRSNMAMLMAKDLIDNLPIDASGEIDMNSSVMLVGHDIRDERE